MSLSERTRSMLYDGLRVMFDDDEAAAEVIAKFPTNELDELVTHDQLRAEMAELRVEMAKGFADLRRDVSTTMRNWVLGGAGLLVAGVGLILALARVLIGS